MRLDSSYIIDFSKIGKADEDLVGKKAYELGQLQKLGIPFPNGFVITTKFQREFLRFTKISEEIKKVQALNHPAISGSIKELFHPIQKQIIEQDMPQVLATQLHKFYRKLSGTFRERSLTLFSSSFNNKSIVSSNVSGDTNLILKIKTIWSMLPTESVAVVVQENIQSQIKGRIFTDGLTIDKKLTEKQMGKLKSYCSVIQEHFYFPKEIEYAVKKDEIFITKVNPFTGTISKSSKAALNNGKQKALIKGIPINPGIVTGPVKVLRNIYSDTEMKEGSVIILPNLNPSLFSKIKKAKAIIVDSVLPNSLDKILYKRDFQIPTVEGVKNATKMFQDGNVITVNGATGEIYSGGLI